MNLTDRKTWSQLTFPPALNDWEERVAFWCDDYEAAVERAILIEFDLALGVYLFDQSLERVILAYAVSCKEHVRDKSRMRGFPDVNRSIRSALGDRAFGVLKEDKEWWLARFDNRK